MNSCIGGTSSLSATNSPSLSNPWTSSNPAVASVNTSGLVSGLTSGSSTITYTDINGCTTTALFTVNPNPTISGTSTICIGSTSQLIGSATAAVSSPWVSSNTSVATISSTGLVSGISAGTTTITYTNTNGCIQTYLITVLNPPNITNPGSITRCDSYTLPAITGSFLTSNANYYTASQASSGVLIANGASITTSQTVWIYDNNGTCSDEESFVVTINTTPVVSFSSDINSGCLPLTVTFTNNTIPIGQSVTWNFGDGTIVNLNQNLQSVTHTFQTEDCFDIQLTSTNDFSISNFSR